MIVFLLDSGHRAMSSEKIAASYSDEAKEILDGHCNLPNQPLRITFFLVIGLIGLPVAAYFTVNGATQIARDFGVSEAIIGLTIVAIGTSLPELSNDYDGSISERIVGLHLVMYLALICLIFWR